ncbi:MULTISPECIES: M23 family metallopeptidase [unclassified Polynucleobacter]|uniref:M23 family metallopeptidase n=1 Tax=unclassified Polynucleobacter TaxID=2640945 RepID=UPI000BD2AF96|nr:MULTISPECIES: M23 family metallopeptidase [unclassified Polynucleobacter]OYY21703.1 MAG: peptidase M23 [Polynucleobacter sp. 35-46-11]OZA78341.1 MAG: peptidase M23 [Polynucleobacter sp. 39-46-10]
MNKKVSSLPYLLRNVINVIGLSLIVFISSAQAQQASQTGKASKTPQIKQKVASTSNKQAGIQLKENSLSRGTKSMSLNPQLFKRIEGAPSSQGGANLDYRVQRGCLRRSYNEENLPTNLGLDDGNFNDFFKSQTKGFLDRMRGNCIPYALALGSRNRFESLSIMNGPMQDAKTEVWTFTPSAAGSFLIQQDYLKDESKRFTEIQLALSDVLYDPKKVGDKLPVELVWELNSVIKQIYPEENNALENTNSIVRLIVDFGDKERWAQIWAAEIIDPASGEVFSSAFWVERSDIPGGFYTAGGESIERTFWTNPLSYRRISRGVGSVRASSKKAAPSKNGAPVATPKQRYRTHMGIDYSAPTGTPIFSVATGKIVHLGFSGAFGNLIILEHPGNYRTYYAHLSNYNVELEVGNEVRRGLEIGYVGSTGRSTGPHLHFELRKDGVYVDPYATKTQLDLWNMRDSDSGLLTREILLLGTPLVN